MDDWIRNSFLPRVVKITSTGFNYFSQILITSLLVFPLEISNLCEFAFHSRDWNQRTPDSHRANPIHYFSQCLLKRNGKIRVGKAHAFESRRISVNLNTESAPMDPVDLHPPTDYSIRPFSCVSQHSGTNREHVVPYICRTPAHPFHVVFIFLHSALSHSLNHYHHQPACTVHPLCHLPTIRIRVFFRTPSLSPSFFMTHVCEVGTERG